jgi:hypothetical protein
MTTAGGKGAEGGAWLASGAESFHQPPAGADGLGTGTDAGLTSSDHQAGAAEGLAAASVGVVGPARIAGFAGAAAGAGGMGMEPAVSATDSCHQPETGAALGLGAGFTSSDHQAGSEVGAGGAMAVGTAGRGGGVLDGAGGVSLVAIETTGMDGGAMCTAPTAGTGAAISLGEKGAGAAAPGASCHQFTAGTVEATGAGGGETSDCHQEAGAWESDASFLWRAAESSNMSRAETISALMRAISLRNSSGPWPRSRYLQPSRHASVDGSSGGACSRSNWRSAADRMASGLTSAGSMPSN